MSFSVIITTPMWSLNGVNVFSANLARGLNTRGVPVRILLTRPYEYDPKPMPLPADIRIETLPSRQTDSWPKRWREMIRYLEDHAPCIYIPNHDYAYSCISPRLSRRVGIVGVVHADDEEHHGHVARLGRYWNAVVTASAVVAEHVIARQPALAPRVHIIPHGVAIPAAFPLRTRQAGAPLRIVYAGRLIQYQKRVFDLPEIVRTLLAMQVPVELALIGAGPDQDRLVTESQDLIEKGAMRFLGILSNDEVLETFARSDVFIMTSDSEGFSLSALEAMGRGCVPVVGDIAGGVPEMVLDGVNGYRLAIGDIQAFASRIAALYHQPDVCQQLSLAAYTSVDKGGYRIEDMARRYADVSERALDEAAAGHFRRPHGRIVPPPSLILPHPDPLPAPLRRIGRLGKRMLRPLWSAYRSRLRGAVDGTH